MKFCVGVDLLIDYHVDPGTTGWVSIDPRMLFALVRELDEDVDLCLR